MYYPKSGILVWFLMEVNYSDLFLVLFAFICIWMAIEISGGGGGGHRARVPARF